MDYLVDHDIQADTATNGELYVLPYFGIQPTGGKARGRSAEGLDCPLAPIAPQLSRLELGQRRPHRRGRRESAATPTATSARSATSGRQVHHDGEIWGQTLWDLRKSLITHHGEATGLRSMSARSSVPRACEWRRSIHSYLDVRDAMLVADSAMGLGDHDRIWNAFAARGMGVDASTGGSFDTFPDEDFDAPTDNQAPETSIDKVRVNREKRSAKVTMSGVDPAPASLRSSYPLAHIDAKPFAACGAVQTFKKLKRGTHTVEAAATRRGVQWQHDTRHHDLQGQEAVAGRPARYCRGQKAGRPEGPCP